MSDYVIMSLFHVINRCHGPWVSLHALTTGAKQEDQRILSHRHCDESESCLWSRIPASQSQPGARRSDPRRPCVISPNSRTGRLPVPGPGPASLCSSFPVTVLPLPGRRPLTSPAQPSPAHTRPPPSLLQIMSGHHDQDFPTQPKTKINSN